MANQDQSAPTARESAQTVRVRSGAQVPAHAKLEESKTQTKAQTFTSALKAASTVVHHLFKLKVAKFMKNDSWKKDAPEFHFLEHCHIYHTVDSMGRPQEFCGYVGGHTHRVKVVENEDGTVTAEVGPPLMKQSYKGRDGRTKTKMVAVRFFDKYAGKESEELDENGEPMISGGKWIVDDHSHELEYGKKEIWTIGEMQARGGKLIAPMDDGLSHQREVLKKADVSIR